MTLNEIQSLERVLESAVVVSWADLMRGAQTGLIHIEYGFARSCTLDYLGSGRISPDGNIGSASQLNAELR